MKPIFRKMILITGLILLFQITGLAQTNTEAGIKLYQDGKYTEAAQILKNASKKDPAAAYYLGLSYEKLGQIKEAIAVYGRSIEDVIYQLGQNLIKANQGTRKDADLDTENYIRSRMAKKIDSAFESSMRLKEIDPKARASNDWENKNLALDVYRTKSFETSATAALTPLNIISKRPPTYTDEARKEQVGGEIKLIVFFLANGKIGLVIPCNNLPYGLTENAVEAARRIEFSPAKRGDRAVTVTKIITYNFWLM